MINMLKELLHYLLGIYSQLKIEKNLKAKGINIQRPFSPFDTSHLEVHPPIYIGPDAWFSLRGKLKIGRGTIIGPRLKVHTSNHRWEGVMLPYGDKYLVKDVVIGEQRMDWIRRFYNGWS